MITRRGAGLQPNPCARARQPDIAHQDIAHQGLDQVVLGREPPVAGPPPDPGGLGDLLDAGGLERTRTSASACGL